MTCLKTVVKAQGYVTFENPPLSYEEKLKVLEDAVRQTTQFFAKGVDMGGTPANWLIGLLDLRQAPTLDEETRM